MDRQRGVSRSHCALRSTPRRTAIINARLQSGFTTDNPLAHFQTAFRALHVHVQAGTSRVPAVLFHGSRRLLFSSVIVVSLASTDSNLLDGGTCLRSTRFVPPILFRDSHRINGLPGRL